MRFIVSPLFALGLALAVAIILAAAIVLLLRRYKNVRQRLGIRIALLILLTGPAVFFALIFLNAVYSSTIGQPAPLWTHLIQLALIVLGTPLLLGLLAARYVTRPLSEFTRAIASIKDNDYRLRLQKSGVYEFDRVFVEFNELFERLSEEEALRKNLISDTSHELNTPITSLIGQLEGMKEGVIKKDAAHLDVLLGEANRLRDTAERLVEYARLQSHTLQMHITEVDLAALLAELGREYANELQKAHMEMLTRLAVKTIRADRMLLKRLLANLIINAIYYSGGSAITVSYDGKVLAVADNGRGVPQESLNHLFERFYRVDASRSRHTGGLGLGLAIVQEIAQAHDWRLTAHNGKPGLILAMEPSFIQNSHAPALLGNMKKTSISSPAQHFSSFREITPWIAIALIALGLTFFTYTAVQQDYRMSANDPQVQMAQDAASAWNNGASPSSLVLPKKVDMGSSLAPFTIIVDKNGHVLASDGQLNGMTPLPPLSVFSGVAENGERRFTWQTDGGLRFAAVVEPTPNGAVLTARSLKEAESREQILTWMAGLTLLGVVGVLVLAYLVIAR